MTEMHINVWKCINAIKYTLFEGNYFILCILMSFLCVSVCMTCIPGACRSQKGVLGPLELKLQMVLRHCVSAGSSASVSSALSH